MVQHYFSLDVFQKLIAEIDGRQHGSMATSPIQGTEETARKTVAVKWSKAA